MPKTKRPSDYFEELTAAARAASLRATLAARPTQAEIWVFAYGSLIWRPCFDHAERHAATLADYRRRFSVWTLIARGSPAAPGLALALEAAAGHRCHGVAYCLDPNTATAGLEALWQREMLTSIYQPRWVSVALAGRVVPAIGFVADPTDPQYAGTLSPAEQAALIATAHGQFGSCRDYLANTVAELATLGIEEPELSALLRAVDALAAVGDDQDSVAP